VNGPAHPRDLLLGRVIEWFAANGVLDTSMRTLAAGVGTSNRMLNYHFGSREQLLADVTATVCEAEDESLRDCLAASEEPVDGAASYWHHAATTASVFAPLFYELSAHAYGKPYAERLAQVLTGTWVAGFAEGLARVTGPGARRAAGTVVPGRRPWGARRGRAHRGPGGRRRGDRRAPRDGQERPRASRAARSRSAYSRCSHSSLRITSRHSRTA